MPNVETKETKSTQNVSFSRNAITFARCMEEMQLKILEHSIDLYFKYGIRSVTMDDVAREMGISKKTLYKYVSNKADLVEQSVKFKFSQVNHMLKTYAKEVENAIDELFAIDAYFIEMMSQSQPAVMFQLAKYYPEAYKWLYEAKTKQVLDNSQANLKKGKDQGLYRADINIENISYIYLAHTNLMEEGDTGVPKEVCHSPEFHQHHLEYHIRGIASKQGLIYLNKKLNKQKWKGY